MEKIKKLAGFLRLLDEDGTLSITNISAMALVVKILVQPEVDIAGVSMLLTALSAYSFKRYTQRTGKKETPSQDFTADIGKLRDDLNKLKLKEGFKLGN